MRASHTTTVGPGVLDAPNPVAIAHEMIACREPHKHCPPKIPAVTVTHTHPTESSGTSNTQSQTETRGAPGTRQEWGDQVTTHITSATPPQTLVSLKDAPSRSRHDKRGPPSRGCCGACGALRGVGLLAVVPSCASRVRAHQEGRSRPGGSAPLARARPRPAVTPQAPGLQAPASPETRVCAPGPHRGRLYVHELWEPAPGPRPGPIPPPRGPLPTPSSAALLTRTWMRRPGCGARAGRPAALSWASGALACLGRRPHRTPRPAQKAGAAGGRRGVSDTPFLLPPLASRRRPRREGGPGRSARASA